jgi:hypothetical protein
MERFAEAFMRPICIKPLRPGKKTPFAGIADPAHCLSITILFRINKDENGSSTFSVE